jgi:hypothetical protein
MLDNIGLPYSGINIALSDSATVGPDGRRDPDLAEAEKHTPTAELVAMLRRELPKRFPSCSSSSSPPTSSTRC